MRMLKTILRQFSHAPVTTRFPAESARSFGATRGHVVFDPSRCTSCSLCVKRCPSQAITVDRAAKVWTIDRFRCVVCSQCVELCKFGAVCVDTRYSAAATQDERGREEHVITYVKPGKPVKPEKNSDSS